MCLKYGNIDISKEPIPVKPSVHFFMGGLAVHNNHETNIRNLFAVGECASIYHGANRLGGNSLLAALYGGTVAADEISARDAVLKKPDFTDQIKKENLKLQNIMDSKSSFPVMYIRDMAAETMKCNMGIVRNEESLDKGISDIDYYLSVADRISYDRNVIMYANYSLTGILTLARASLCCAKERRESRGSHYRSDYPETSDSFGSATIISYDEGQYRVRPDKERFYES